MKNKCLITVLMGSYREGNEERAVSNKHHGSLSVDKNLSIATYFSFYPSRLLFNEQDEADRLFTYGG